MTTPALWVEITIAGALYLAGICFVFLGGYRVSVLPAPSEVKDYLPYLSVAAVAASYIIGIVIHRVSQFLARPIIMRLLRLPKLHAANSAEEHFANLVMIWQFGSQRVHRELDFQFSLVVLFRSLVLSIPFAFSSLEFWLIRTHQNFRWGFLTIGVCLWASCLVAYRRQCIHYGAIELASLGRVRNLKINSG